MSSIQAMPGRGVGYVRAVFSKRGKGFSAPVDLLRVHMRAVVRSGERRRVAAAFAGYLVTDAGPVSVFSERRGLYTARRWDTGIGRTGFSSGEDGGGDIDAPGWIPAGGMRAMVGRLAEMRCYPLYMSRDRGQV